ncbi:hypothetical protein PQO03_18430 [Lentisphaera profundi]|uniref:Lon N-terminal domain-containing protein n=1 Tax=Lentisphaera profundi TaxID=1658616 RepID=A0ABY7VVR6_9BACT|nr:LON peptidase substrate-binding domain-containing protein [Lentisphaera profundi]WDE97807.1 hypothetical protein PQO03_18430 [Lentisphaera profundi]
MSLNKKLYLIPIHNPIIFPGVKTRIDIPYHYEETIQKLLDSPGNLILAYQQEGLEPQLYNTASLVCIENFDKKADGHWELLVKAYARASLNEPNLIKAHEQSSDYQLLSYLDEEFISSEEEANIKGALQIKIKKNFPNMAPHLYSELMEDFSISKFLHYLCFSSNKSQNTKIELLKYTSLYKLYQKLIDGFMK